ncbi:MAG: IS110 family transposase [Gammaproteobacteria bacterium]|nr:IS110 family transposase [Gammaproteobacteria bacterium]
MTNIARVGIDLAKQVFHVTALDDSGAVMERKKLRRAGLQSYLALLPRGCVVAMEACGSANHWGRFAARHGHRVRLMSPQFAAPYVKSNKNDVNDADNELPYEGRALLRELGDELRRLDERVRGFDAQIEALARRTPACRRLMAIPGVGQVTATALVAAVGDATQFRNGREMAAWLGLVPRQRSTGGRPTLLGISKRGDRHLRTLLIPGARRALLRAPRGRDRRSRWAVATRERRGWNIAVVALANKNVRAAWAVLAREAEFDAAHIGKAA